MLTRGQEMHRLQRKLIPVNLIVCIISLVAAFTLFFTPLIKINIGKIVSSNDVQQFVSGYVADQIGGNGGAKTAAEEGEGEEGSGSGSDIKFDFDIATVAKPIVCNVLANMKGDVALSPFTVTKLAFSKDAGTDIKNMFVSDDGLVMQLVESLANGFQDMFKSPEVVAALEEAVIDAVTNMLADNLASGLDISEAQMDELKDAFQELGGAETREDAQTAVTNYLDKMDAIDGIELSAENKESVTNQILEMYDKTVEATGGEFSIEAMICVNASDSLGNIQIIDIGALLESLIGSNNSSEPENNAGIQLLKTVAVEGEVGEGSGSTEGGTTGGEGTEGPTEEKKTYTSFDELANSVVKMPETEELKKQVSELVNGKMDGAVNSVNELNESIHIMWIAFGVLAFFAFVWIVLFLFAFFHMFARNKRFTTWYVKIFAPWPCILFWLIPTIFRSFPKFLPWLGLKLGFGSTIDKYNGLINGVLSGFSSAAWISGLCYLILWAVMLFWAFPIKHKIRKLKKFMKE